MTNEQSIIRNEPLSDDCRETYSRSWGIHLPWQREYVRGFYLWLSNIELERPEEPFSVPVIFQTPERAFAEKIRPTNNRGTVDLPIISFTLTQLSFDRSRFAAPPNLTWEKQFVNGKWERIPKPMPWDFNFNVTIWGRFFQDLDIIDYHLLSRFTPSSYIRPYNIPSLIELQGVTDTSTLEPGEGTDRILRHDLQFGVKGWMPLPATRVDPITGIDIILTGDNDTGDIITDPSNFVNIVEDDFEIDTGNAPQQSAQVVAYEVDKSVTIGESGAGSGGTGLTPPQVSFPLGVTPGITIETLSPFILASLHIYAQNPVFKITAADLRGVQNISYYIDDAAKQTSTFGSVNIVEELEIGFTSVDFGVHSLNIEYTDRQGNITTKSIQFEVEDEIEAVLTVVPPASTVIPAIGVIPTADFEFDVVLGTRGLGHFEYRLNSGPWINNGKDTSVSISSLEAGTYTFDVRAVDDLGKISSTIASYIFIYTQDTTAPTINIVQDTSGQTVVPVGSPTFLHVYDNTATFDFTISDNEEVFSVEYRLDGGSWIALSLVSPLAYNISFVSLTTGTHTLEVRAIDTSSNVAIQSYDWSVETVTNTQIDSNPSLIDNDQTPTFTFSAISNTRPVGFFEYRVDGGGWVNNGATGSVTLPTLSEAAHTFEVRATDDLGIVDPTPAIYNWQIDITPPNLTLNYDPTSPAQTTVSAANFHVYDSLINFTTTVSDANTVVDYNYVLDGASPSVPLSDPSDTINLTGLSTGSHTVQVNAEDIGGNTNSQSFTWFAETFINTSLDTTPPTFDNDQTPTFGFSAILGTRPLGKLEYRVDGGSWTDNGTNTSVTLPTQTETAHTFEVRAVDDLGIADPTPPAVYNWTIDITPPALTLVFDPTSPAQTIVDTSPGFHVYDNAINFTTSVSDTNTVTDYNYSLDSTSPATALTQPSDTINLTSLGTGSHSVEVFAQDVAGNTNTETFDWDVETFIDTSLDNTPSDPDTDNTPTFDFSAILGTRPLDKFQYKVDAGSWTDVTPNSSPANTGTVTLPVLTYDTHTFQVRAVDDLGVEDSTPPSYTWEIIPPLYEDFYNEVSDTFLPPHPPDDGVDLTYDAFLGVGNRLKVVGGAGYLTVEDNTANGQYGAEIGIGTKKISTGTLLTTIIADNTPPVSGQRIDYIYRVLTSDNQNGFILKVSITNDDTFTQFQGYERVSGVDTLLLSFVVDKGANYTVDFNMDPTLLQIKVNSRVEQAVHSLNTSPSLTLFKLQKVIELSGIASPESSFPDPQILSTVQGDVL